MDASQFSPRTLFTTLSDLGLTEIPVSPSTCLTQHSTILRMEEETTVRPDDLRQSEHSAYYFWHRVIHVLLGITL